MEVVPNIAANLRPGRMIFGHWLEYNAVATQWARACPAYNRPRAIFCGRPVVEFVHENECRYARG
jgi:hypothetical protein